MDNQDTHLNAIVRLPEQIELLLEAGRLDLLCGPAEADKILIYDEDVPDSEKLMEFAIRNNLMVCQIANDGGHIVGPAYAPIVHRNIYKITRTSGVDYDQFSGFVCIASSLDRAKLLNPRGWLEGEDPLYNVVDSWSYWESDPAKIIGEYLGPAYDGAKEQIVLASFHAG